MNSISTHIRHPLGWVRTLGKTVTQSAAGLTHGLEGLAHEVVEVSQEIKNHVREEALPTAAAVALAATCVASLPSRLPGLGNEDPDASTETIPAGWQTERPESALSAMAGATSVEDWCHDPYAADIERLVIRIADPTPEPAVEKPPIPEPRRRAPIVDPTPNPVSESADRVTDEAPAFLYEMGPDGSRDGHELDESRRDDGLGANFGADPGYVPGSIGGFGGGGPSIGGF